VFSLSEPSSSDSRQVRHCHLSYFSWPRSGDKTSADTCKCMSAHGGFLSIVSIARILWSTLELTKSELTRPACVRPATAGENNVRHVLLTDEIPTPA